MRYHYKSTAGNYISGVYGRLYRCEHSVYRRCTLYEKDGRGLAVIQQRFSDESKKTWWTEIDADLVDALYEQKGFTEIFDHLAAEPQNGIYPTLTVRQLMWKLRMKPLKKEIWETVFDHDIN